MVQRLHRCAVMHHVHEPRTFALDHLTIMRQLWQGVRDGDVESVHQARVATRRIRAALPVIDGVDNEDVELFRTIGRCLGRVRDFDVTQELFATFETRVPDAACAVAALRRAAGTAQHQARRRMVKTFDEIDLDASARRLRGRPGLIASLSFRKGWRTELLSRIATHAIALESAIESASGVYMPNRLHRVRISTKKLRYLLELADATGMSISSYLVRDLRKAQDTLGRMHDLHAMLNHVRRFDSPSKSLAAEVRVLEAVMSSQCSELHQKYLPQRDRLRLICRRCDVVANRSRLRRLGRAMTRVLPAAGLVALPLAMWRVGAGSTDGSRT
jgi:CHAD domain-containing protein